MKYRLLVVAAAVLWSTSGAAIKLSSLSGIQLACGRSAVAGLFLFLCFPEARRRLDRQSLGAVIAYAATVMLFVLASKATTSANAIFLQSTAPLYVLFLSGPLLGERPTRSEFLAAPIFLIGLSLFFLDQLQPGQVRGNLLALMSGLGFAFTILFFRMLREKSAAVLGWGNLLCALVTLPWALQGPVPTPTDWALLAFLGVVQLGLAYVLFTRGVAHLPAIEASLIALLEPVLNPIWAFLFAGERPGPWAMLGGAVILFATGWRILLPLWSSEARTA